ncbi:cobalamin synthesis protein/P47K [Agrobacterium tumefaciens CCNWGS0286]|uniref:CobW family GTP-binding protein n=1 Tax=Agrobacterium tumefaciens TaxID=358 RepID=UPI0002334939|nr:GTP-binding protein [Agrobacterium tumefaciens]EHH03611.1 cobalamin synthesis protein/P47K [Agrobacterium tumefaciens CCNWGS0286]
MSHVLPKPTPPEFVLLTGALGSGKTTLLSDYLALGAPSDTGVIINDAGEINVDGVVIGADNRDLAMATIGDGCICCSLGNGVQEGIDALLLARAERGLAPLRRIILETSGLAEPAPILRSLRQIRQLRFNLRIVTTFDAFQPRAGDDFLPPYAAQLAAAQTVVLTKLDRLSEDDWAPAATQARNFNPFAFQLVEANRLQRAKTTFDSDRHIEPPRVSQFAAQTGEPSRIKVGFARWHPSAAWGEISAWIEDISGHLDSRLLRMKGFVKPSGSLTALLINGVGGIFAPPRSIQVDDNNDLGLMMILRDVDAEEFIKASGPTNKLELSFK